MHAIQENLTNTKHHQLIPDLFSPGTINKRVRINIDKALDLLVDQIRYGFKERLILPIFKVCVFYTKTPPERNKMLQK